METRLRIVFNSSVGMIQDLLLKSSLLKNVICENICELTTPASLRVNILDCF